MSPNNYDHARRHSSRSVLPTRGFFNVCEISHRDTVFNVPYGVSNPYSPPSCQPPRPGSSPRSWDWKADWLPTKPPRRSKTLHTEAYGEQFIARKWRCPQPWRCPPQDMLVHGSGISEKRAIGEGLFDAIERSMMSAPGA